MAQVKTTIDLPDHLLIAAKKRAAELHRPLRSLIEEALRAQLKQPLRKTRKSPKIRWVTVDGGLPPKLDISDRAKMHEWLLQK